MVSPETFMGRHESNVQRLVTKFKAGETSIDDKPCVGRPAAVMTNNNQQWVDDMVHVDRQITVHEIVVRLN